MYESHHKHMLVCSKCEQYSEEISDENHGKTFIGKPCPKCGEILLTQEQWDATQTVDREMIQEFVALLMRAIPLCMEALKNRPLQNKKVPIRISAEPEKESTKIRILIDLPNKEKESPTSAKSWHKQTLN